MGRMRRYKTTVGVEFTFQPKKEFYDKETKAYDKIEGTVSELTAREFHKYKDAIFAFEDKMKLIVDTYFKGRHGLGAAHRDGHVLEVPIGPFNYEDSVLSAFESLLEIAEATKLAPHRVETKRNGEIVEYGTGGGHVHLYLFPFEKKDTEVNQLLVRNLLVYIRNRPWLNWVFNEWMDSSNANSLRTFTRAEIEKLEMGSLFNAKNYALNFKDHDEPFGNRPLFHTAEFRFFTAPKNEQMVKDHIDIAHQIYVHCLKLARKGLKVKHVKELPFKQVAKDTPRLLRLTCKELKLDPKRYESYLVNLEDRKAFGELT